MDHNKSVDVCIVGASEVAEARDANTSYWALAARCAKAAIEDAGLSKKDIDGVVFNYPAVRPQFPAYVSTFCEYMGLPPIWIGPMAYGGTGPAQVMGRATSAIEAGFAHTLLLISVENRNTRIGHGASVSAMASHNIDTEFEWPAGLLMPSIFALIAQRHMYEYGTTSEQLAAVAVASRKWAQMHPSSQKRDLITVEDVLNSKMVSSPLHRLDCCLLSPGGGGAVVMTTVERAKGCRKAPIRVLGLGEYNGGQTISQKPTLTHFESVTLAMEKALQTAKVERSDFDIVYAYDGATIFPIYELEDMGFCKKGEGGPFVQGGRIEPGGAFPMNTHGGTLSHLHPGGHAGGFLTLVEAVRQLRHECGERQVVDAELVCWQTGTPFHSNTVTILGRS